MKTSQATQKIRSIKSKYLSKYIFLICLFIIVTLSLLFIYLSSQYLELPYKEWVINNLGFLFLDDSKTQLIINIASSLVIVLLNVVFILVIYYIFNSKYQKKFLEIFFEELKLNEIYFLEKRITNFNQILDQVDCSINKKDIIYEHMFSVKSLFDLNFVQSYIKKIKNEDGLIITSETNRLLDGYIEIKFDSLMNVNEFSNKGVNQFIIDDSSKYPFPLYINSNMNKLTHRMVDEKAIQKIYQLKKYTKSKFTFCIYENKFFIHINGWALRLTDSLRKQLTFNSIDKKIDSFTQLIDDLQDLYICILRNYEVIKYGK